jgi:hypothetical protein
MQRWELPPDSLPLPMIWSFPRPVVFDGGEPAGTQTGHCVQVWDGVQLACYFNFKLLKGNIVAEALFDLTDFPNADLVITGGTGKYLGIIGSAKTRAPPDFDGTTFFYDFKYRIRR